MCDNRTSEFLSYAKGLPGADRVSTTSASASLHQQSAGAGSDGNKDTASAASKNKNYSELRDFHQTAAEISRDIATTSALLSELTQLVKHKSLFQDDASKINPLVVRIKTNVESLNARLDQAGRTLAAQKRNLGKNSQAGQEATNLVDGLKTEFAEAASDFKKVLQQRTDNLKESDLMQQHVYGNGGNGSQNDDDPIPNMSALSAPPPVYGSSSLSLGVGGAVAGGQQGNTYSANNAFPTLDLTSGLMPPGEATGPVGLPRPHGISAPNSGGVSHLTSASAAAAMRNRRGSAHSADGLATYSGAYSTYERQQSAPLTPLDIQRMEEESGQSQTMQLIPDHDYLRERADAMSQVESGIVELGTIFNKLAVMVSEHRDMVHRVEDNVEDANANINLSLGALTDTLTSLQTNRGLALKVFSLLVMFIIFFIVFFA